MLLIKIYCHSICTLKKLLFRVLYRNKFKLGRGTSFRRHFGLMIENTGHVEIGSQCFFNDDCSIASMGHVRIGDGTIFGANVRIYDHNHHFSDTKRPIKEQGYTVGEVNIGSHCWIASNVTLLKGCRIGDNCMIGTGCVVSEMIPDNTVIRLVQQKQYSTLRVNANN